MVELSQVVGVIDLWRVARSSYITHLFRLIIYLRVLPDLTGLVGYFVYLEV